MLSDAYLADHGAEFENLVAQTLGVETGSWRLIPVSFGAFDRSRLPVRLGMLTALELGEPLGRDLGAAWGGSRHAERAMQRLVAALQLPAC